MNMVLVRASEWWNFPKRLAGPYCAMLLGDLGADVIKVERNAGGDQSRNWGPPFVGTESRLLPRHQSQQTFHHFELRPYLRQ